jgi:hypothetical protein
MAIGLTYHVGDMHFRAAFGGVLARDLLMSALHVSHSPCGTYQVNSFAEMIHSQTRLTPSGQQHPLHLSRVVTKHNMLRLSGTSVYGLMGSSHRHHAAITIALGFTTSSVAATSAVRTVASMRHVVNQMQRIHPTASATGAATVVTLVSLPMPLSSSRRQSSASAAGDHACNFAALC